MAQIILSGLYCLTMVLMPHLHLVLDAHEADVFASSDCCSHQQEQPEQNNHDSHDVDSCSFCQLLALASETLDTRPALQSTFSVVPFISGPDPVYTSIPACGNQARAPPFMTV